VATKLKNKVEVVPVANWVSKYPSKKPEVKPVKVKKGK